MKTVTMQDIYTLAELETIYQEMRFIQAQHNATSKTPCQQSGQCCKIGLQIPMLECMNIALQLNKGYFEEMEIEGQATADEHFRWIKDDLIARMYDENWDGEGKNDMWCAFWSTDWNGCGIYDIRPMVCRAYGSIVTVDDVCPRKRMDDGTIEVIGGEQVKNLVTRFKELMERFGKAHPQWDYVVYMPMGVLQFLLSDSELEELARDTDAKFWQGSPWYNTYFMNKILGEENKNSSQSVASPTLLA